MRAIWRLAPRLLAVSVVLGLAACGGEHQAETAGDSADMARVEGAVVYRERMLLPRAPGWRSSCRISPGPMPAPPYWRPCCCLRRAPHPTVSLSTMTRRGSTRACVTRCARQFIPATNCYSHPPTILIRSRAIRWRSWCSGFPRLYGGPAWPWRTCLGPAYPGGRAGLCRRGRQTVDLQFDGAERRRGFLRL